MLCRSFSTKIAKFPSDRFLRASRNQHSMSSPAPTEGDSLFRYTSGRWLWNEDEQLKLRSRRFNVPNLKKEACRAVGVNACTSLEKIGEGNYNKAYRLIMEDGRKVIAKIPHPNAGPPMLTTASEVATMEFARTILGLPVPKVLAWSATDQNPVDAEYIIMEEAKGSQLHGVWQDLQLRAKLDIIQQIVDIETKLLSISFDKIGSLYFNDSNIPGHEPATATNCSQEVSESIRSHYLIGPAVRREFWEKERRGMRQYQGPWNSSIEYLVSVASREIDWIGTYADPQKSIGNPWQYSSAEQNSPEVHIASLRKFLSAISYIVPKEPEIVSPRIWHPDFHAGNIYVDEQNQISCIIDWQGTWTTPVFIGANPPLLLDYGVDMLMKLPENFKQLDKATQEKLRYQVSQSILIHSYETLTSQKNPLMYKMMRHPHGKTLKQLEAFAGSTWDNCLYPFRECLIAVEREWEHFQTNEPCPFHFSAEELQRHYEEAETFNESQKFWEGLRGILTDEGYTSNETFSQAVQILRDLRKSGLANLEGEEREEFDRKTRSILDLSA